VVSFEHIPGVQPNFTLDEYYEIVGLTPFGGHRLCGLVDRSGDPVLEGYRRDLAE